MAMALEEANKAKELGEVPVGAIIVASDGTVIVAPWLQPYYR